MIKAVLFDLDNTLTDFMKMKRAACAAAVRAMVGAGLKLNQKRALELLFKLYGRYGIEYGRIFQRFLERVGTKVDYRTLAAGIVAYRRAQGALLKPYPHTAETLAALRAAGLKLGIVSDAPRLKVWIRLCELGLQHFFDIVVTAADVRAKKPSAAPFLFALRALKMKADEVLMVGDIPARDIAGAKAAGLKSCLAAYGNNRSAGLKGPRADYTIKTIAQLRGVIEAENSRR